MRDNEFRRSVASKLAWARMSKGITQQEVADRLGTSKSTISRIESGNQNITVDYAQAYAGALNLQPAFSVCEQTSHYGEITDYVLKLYDEPLVEFTMKKEALGIRCAVTCINEDCRHLFPLDLDLSDEGLYSWLSSRVVPKNREYAGAILQAAGLEENSVKDIIDVCRGLSLNDSYWVVPADFSGRFADYNLYENDFSAVLSLVAYTGYPYRDEKFNTSPEFTTCGMLRKAWRFKSDGIWLYKGGTEGFANAGNEPYSEFLAWQIAKKMGLHATEYVLENWKGILASKCRLFTDINTSFVPVGKIVKNGGVRACLDFYKNLGENYYQELVSMYVFDAVIVNEDRHFGNFGLLRDNLSGEFISPAPIFDNGNALLAHAMKSDFESQEIFDAYLMSLRPVSGGNYFDLCREIMGSKQKSQLRKLIGFRFADSDVSNLPRWRIQKLEELIQDRVRRLLLQ